MSKKGSKNVYKEVDLTTEVDDLNIKTKEDYDHYFGKFQDKYLEYSEIMRKTDDYRKATIEQMKKIQTRFKEIYKLEPDMDRDSDNEPEEVVIEKPKKVKSKKAPPKTKSTKKSSVKKGETESELIVDNDVEEEDIAIKKTPAKKKPAKKKKPTKSKAKKKKSDEDDE